MAEAAFSHKAAALTCPPCPPISEADPKHAQGTPAPLDAGTGARPPESDT